MCGISFIVSDDHCLDDSDGHDDSFDHGDSVRGCWQDPYAALLQNRGSSHLNTLRIHHPWFMLKAQSTVLHLRGTCFNDPPAISKSSVLLFNGQIYSCDHEPLPPDQNDTSWLLNRLEQCSDDWDVCSVLESLRGPWALVYYMRGKLWIARDILGRRSLCWNLIVDGKSIRPMRSNQNTLFISSVAMSNCYAMQEIPTDRLFCLDINSLDKISDISEISMENFFWPRTISGGCPSLTQEIQMLSKCPIETELNCQLPVSGNDWHIPEIVRQNFFSVLKDSVAIRCHRYFQGCCDRCYLAGIEIWPQCRHPGIAVLFSGGLDSAVLALLVHLSAMSEGLGQEGRPIDLLNVAFMPDAPDRQTGLQAWQELSRLHPDVRWNFVAIDVTAEEMDRNRPHIMALIEPKSTIMDASIGAALWFAARGLGSLARLNSEGSGLSWIPGYKTPARILLAGMGADEQLGGYSRHRQAFHQGGWPKLIQELRLDIDRLPERNLGRDDRIIADHTRDARFPFLDERCINFLNSLPIWYKCNLNLPRGQGEKLLLREVARDLGLQQAAQFEKRAIQFGSKVVKLQPASAKGTDSIDKFADGTQGKN